MTPGGLYFAFCMLLCLVGAIVTVAAANPVRGAVGLLATILGIAGLFLRLDAQFLAAIQLIVYAGAVVVLFVFVIMLLGPDASDAERAPRGAGSLSSRSGAGIVAGLLFAAMAGGGVALAGRSAGEATRFGPVPADHGTVEAVGGLLFSEGIVPFELSTALLIVAVVGAIAVARGKPGTRRRRAPASNPQELFAGPVHPRDAGRPVGGVVEGGQ